MRRSFFWCLAAMVAMSYSSHSQTTGTRQRAAAHAVVNFAELARQEAARPSPPQRRDPKPFLSPPGNLPVPDDVIKSMKQSVPRAEQSLPKASIASPAAAASFAALGDNGLSIPPDTQGAAGPNHLMVVLNTEVRIQTRAGGIISTVPLSTFWAATGAVGVFDPKLVYEPYNNRWIFSATSSARNADSSVLIGASQSSDPTGAWNLYRIDADAADIKWADYPSLGFNLTWAVVTVNMYNNSNDAFAGSLVYAFEKADLYSAASPLTSVVFNDANNAPTPAYTYNNSLTTMYLLRNWNGNSGGLGFLRMSTITGGVGTEVYTAAGSFVATANPWGFSGGAADFAPQSGTADKIQNNDSRVLSVIYRNGTLWASQSAFLPAAAPTRTSAQWWQINTGGTAAQFGRVDDATGTNFYAFPTLAVNASGDVLMGFSTFSAGIFASAGYAYRASTDASGTMRDPVVFKTGEATYYKTFGTTRNRWGDYSSTVVDPVNDLDFWTIQEYSSSPNFPNGQNRWGTWWAKVAAIVSPRRRQMVSE